MPSAVGTAAAVATATDKAGSRVSYEPRHAGRIVLAEGAAIMIMVTVASIRDGEGFPPPKVFLAGAVAYGALAALSGPAPELAIAIGALGVVYSVLRVNKKGVSLGESAIKAFTGIGSKGFQAPGSQTAGLSPISAAMPVSPTSAVTPSTGAAAPSASARVGSNPLPDLSNIVGRPYGGTHTRGDWASDNAIDFRTPNGTPVFAVAGGSIGSQIGPLNSANPALAGQRLHLLTGDNEYYYAHLSSIIVKPGERVVPGQILGYSGSANGVPHLHFAAKAGNPLQILGLK